MLIKRPFLLTALAITALTPLAATLPAIPVAAQSTTADLDRVSRHLKTVTTLTANFTQTDRTNQTVSGKLTWKQPGRIRFQYQKDVPLLIVSDGKALTLIDYEVNQVQRWPIRNSPLGALLDPDRDLAKYGKVVPTDNPNVLSVRVKDPKRPEYGVITLIFTRKASAPGGIELSGWVALDSQNKRTTIRLSNHKYGAAVSNSAFKWKDPRRKGGPRR
ncbi:outer membrane lipoprotein carrier protein LolA [Sphingorhabdus sp. Alg239-R122]|uniref:LolA family protein n=1 Tax=Sphingorhabdus sp. Alg239-R122 TaxID=2305989 RepID=UPI0013DC6B33|nr:outer membrane lipoprotein carrier protein LolA [Sphingorhabdus sp. Alg239-R122]